MISYANTTSGCYLYLVNFQILKMVVRVLILKTYREETIFYLFIKLWWMNATMFQVGQWTEQNKCSCLGFYIFVDQLSTQVKCDNYHLYFTSTSIRHSFCFNMSLCFQINHTSVCICLTILMFGTQLWTTVLKSKLVIEYHYSN